MNELLKTLERVAASYEGCDCQCQPARTDEKTGYFYEAYECLPCEVKRVLERAKQGEKTLQLTRSS
jgi:hypothetical protein